MGIFLVKPFKNLVKGLKNYAVYLKKGLTFTSLKNQLLLT